MDAEAGGWGERERRRGMVEWWVRVPSKSRRRRSGESGGRGICGGIDREGRGNWAVSERIYTKDISILGMREREYLFLGRAVRRI